MVRSPWQRLWLIGSAAIGLVSINLLSATAQTLPPPPSIGSPDLSQPQPFQADTPQLPPPPQQSINLQPMPAQPANWQTVPTQQSQPFDASFSAPAAATPRYLVILPGEKMVLPLLANQMAQIGIQQNTVQAKDAPYGPHLAIGPYLTYNEAQSVTNLLRRNGMQSARVYFVR